MAPPQLPDVVWRRVVDFLSDTLTPLLDLAALNADLRRICRPHISALFESVMHPVAPLSRDYYYHDLVWLILEGYLDPTLIVNFHYPRQWHVKPPTDCSLSTLGTLAKSSSERRRSRFSRLLEDHVRSARFVPQDKVSEVCTRFHSGEWDAALLILLPLCARLKMLEPPVHAELCIALFRSVAQEHQQRGTSAAEARRFALEAARNDRKTLPLRPRPESGSHPHKLPFSELLFLYVGAHQHGYTFPLTDLTPFMTLPSLHRIILGGIRDQIFPNWPTDIIKPTSPEFYFQESSASREAVRNFAQELTPPCEIRQWYERPRPDVAASHPDDPNWDRVLVSTREDGSKRVEISLEYEGGNPGYGYPWVSWLCRGKMIDWTRIDEEFSNEEGDVDYEWLQGGFA